MQLSWWLLHEKFHIASIQILKFCYFKKAENKNPVTRHIYHTKLCAHVNIKHNIKDSLRNVIG